MKTIANLVQSINEELDGAQHYAECYVEKKAAGDNSWANKFHYMAEDELKHASNLHELAVEEIGKIRAVYKPTDDMLDKWDKAHKCYVGKAAWVKQMLEM